MLQSGACSRRSRGRLSGSASTPQSVAAPKATSAQKIARQDPSARICAPTLGPSKGATAITVVNVESTRAASSR